MEPTNAPLEESGENVEPVVSDVEGGANLNPDVAEVTGNDVSPAPEAVEAAPDGQPEEDELYFNMPGQQNQQRQDAEDNWYKAQYTQLANQLADAQRQLEEFQLSGLDDDERQVRQFEQERDRWNREVEQWRQQQAVREWSDYWSQFTDKPQDIKSMNDPIQMGHKVVTGLYTELSKARKELAALKKAAAKPSAGPPVTTGGQGTAGVRSLFAMSRDEREALMRRARMGVLKDGELPPLK